MKLKPFLEKEKEYHCDEFNNLKASDEFEKGIEADYETMGEANIGGYNTARKEDGEVEVELNVEKVVQVLIKTGYGLPSSKIEQEYRKIAQALNDNLEKCLVRKEE